MLVRKSLDRSEGLEIGTELGKIPRLEFIGQFAKGLFTNPERRLSGASLSA